MADDYSAASHGAEAQPGAPQGQAEPQSGTQAAPEGAQPFAGDPAAGPAVGPGQVPPGANFQGSGYVMDPVTGQLYYKVPVQPGPATMPQGSVPPGTIPPGTNPPGGAQQEVPLPPGPDYAQVIKSVEQFAEGDATVADVVKTLYTNTAQDDQFWKGALVGAAAAVLLTSGPVKETMGKTFGSLFGKAGDAGKAADGAPIPDDKKE